MRKKSSIITPGANLDYDSLLVDHNGDPFDFLQSLKNSNDRPSKDLDPETIAGGKAARESGVFDEEMILKEVDISKMVRSVIDENALVPKDVKIDDGDLPLAKNFYQWTHDDKFAGTVMCPFLEQLIWGIVVFGEWCPRCSDNEYLFFTHKVDDSKSYFLKKVQLLEHGVCPACKSRKSDMVKSGEMPFYQELAVNAGQRCVTADTSILTEDGVMRIGEYAKGKPYGFSRFHLDVHNGEQLETTSDFYKARPERVYRMTLTNGFQLTGTCDHPVNQYAKGFVRLGDVQKGDIVPTLINQQQFGNKHLYFDSVMDSVNSMYAEKHAELKKIKGAGNLKKTAFKAYKSGEICSDMYKVLGLWVAEGRGGTIGNDDQQLLAFCYSTLSKYINQHHLKLGEHGVKIIGYKGRCFLASLMAVTEKDLWSGSAKKHIPVTVRTSTKENICAFLQGLYEGDGGAYCNGAYGDKPTRKKGSVGYATISRSLAYDISAMLNNLGIAHNIRKRMSWATNGTDNQISKPFWSLGVKGEYLQRFLNQIDFMSERKRKALRNAVTSFECRDNKVPYDYENLNCIKENVLALLDHFSSELSVHSLPYTERESPDKFRTYKSAKRMGLCTVYGRKSEQLGFSLRKLRKDNDRALTKEKLKTLCTCALRYSSYMSPQTKFEFEELLDVCSPDIVLTKVKRISLSAKSADTYDFTLPKTHQFITGGVLSHNSGKSACTGGMLTPYMTHRILKMQKPNAVYGIAGSTMLHGTFVALTYAQAKETLWEFYYGTLCSSEWFKEYHSMLRFYESRYGQSLLKFNDTFVVYRPRSLMWYPAGPDKRILRGRTRIFAGIDEIGYFDNDAGSNKVKTSAGAIYDALDASLLTVRGAAERLLEGGHDSILTAYNMNVSSPAAQSDKICSLVRQAEYSQSMYGVHRPTWEVNPTLPRNSKVIQEAYLRTPMEAERNFGANPPLSANPFISNIDFVKNAHGEKRNPIKTSSIIKNRKKVGKATKWAEIDKIGSTHKASMIAIDAGLTNNSFAIVCGRLHEGCVKIDLLTEIMPEPGIPLNYSMIGEEVLDGIIDARNVQVALADRWNSVKVLQDIEQHHGIVAEQYSLKYRDIYLTKSFMENQQLIIPQLEDKHKRNKIEDLTKFDSSHYPKCFEKKPVEHLMVQMLTVQDSGTQVNKGDGLTDDLWRAVCLLVWGLTSEKYDEYMIDCTPVKTRPQAFAASRLGSGGGRSLGSGGGTSGVVGFLKRGS
jgi:intein/homing endonuclease